jgi:hypothetical protein
MKTLNLLIEAMTEAVELDKKLAMFKFFDTEGCIERDTTIHTCGTAACVLGYGALLVGTEGTIALEEQANSLWDDLTEEVGEDLADSIAAPLVFQRTIGARRYCFEHDLPNDWVKEQKHLTTYSTSQDALDYLLELKKRLQNS